MFFYCLTRAEAKPGAPLRTTRTRRRTTWPRSRLEFVFGGGLGSFLLYIYIYLYVISIFPFSCFSLFFSIFCFLFLLRRANSAHTRPLRPSSHAFRDFSLVIHHMTVHYSRSHHSFTLHFSAYHCMAWHGSVALSFCIIVACGVLPGGASYVLVGIFFAIALPYLALHWCFTRHTQNTFICIDYVTLHIRYAYDLYTPMHTCAQCTHACGRVRGPERRGEF